MPLEILYEDNSIIVCIKPVGIVAENAGMVTLLAEHLTASHRNNTVFPVHRLDRDVGGVMVYALTKASAAKLSDDAANHRISKEYAAVFYGTPEKPCGEFHDLLFKDSSKNKSYVVKRMRKGVRDAALSYEIISRAESGNTLARIKLQTGRSHQIRVQFASRRLPLLGDLKYGGKPGCSIALWSCRLVFNHPLSAEHMSIFCPPPNTAPWNEFDTQALKEECTNGKSEK